jgi:hypothetical protein
LREIVIAPQFRGPPNSGNGGYVGGLMAEAIGAATTVVLRAPIPIDAPLRLDGVQDRLRLVDAAGGLIAEAMPARETMDTPPAPPSEAEARAAGARFIGLERMFHPICFCCADALAPGYGLRVFVGQTDGAPAGHVSGAWTPLAPFGDADGLTRIEVIWAALDCPGSVSWAVTEGGGGLLGTMSCEITRRPRVGEACIVTAWPIEQSGRKRLSGTALFTAEGDLLARSRQIWIGRPAS